MHVAAQFSKYRTTRCRPFLILYRRRRSYALIALCGQSNVRSAQWYPQRPGFVVHRAGPLVGRASRRHSFAPSADAGRSPTQILHVGRLDQVNRLPCCINRGAAMLADADADAAAAADAGAHRCGGATPAIISAGIFGRPGDTVLRPLPRSATK